MKSKQLAVATAVATAVLTVASGTAHAAPSAATEAVNYTASVNERSTIIETDGGALTADNGVFTIRADDGTVLAGAELSFRVDDFVFPIAADIAGRKATLTPQFDLAHATYSPVSLPFENEAPWKNSYEREKDAWSRLTTTLGAGATVGTLIGGISGGAVGCLLGGIAGATVASATIIGLFGPFIPAAIIGCLGGIVAVGALGTLAGQLLVTAPVAVLSAVQYFTTITAPPPNRAPAPAPAK